MYFLQNNISELIEKNTTLENSLKIIYFQKLFSIKNRLNELTENLIKTTDFSKDLSNLKDDELSVSFDVKMEELYTSLVFYKTGDKEKLDDLTKIIEKITKTTKLIKYSYPQFIKGYCCDFFPNVQNDNNYECINFYLKFYDYI